MRSARILLVRGTVGDMAVHNNEGGPVGGILEGLERPLKEVEIIRITYPCDVPAVAHEAGGHVFAEGPVGVALDGDLVVVVDPAEVRELQMPSERGGFTGDPLHEVAVAAEDVDIIIEQLKSGSVEVLGHPPARHSHAHARRHALPQWSSRSFHPRRPAVFRMTRTFAVQLPKAFDVLQLHR